jgi:hypothetical protein
MQIHFPIFLTQLLATSGSRHKRWQCPSAKVLAGLTTIGLVGAIALPSFSCGSLERSEAEGRVILMNRTQQAFYLQKKAFAASFAELALNLQEQTDEYTYRTQTNGQIAFTYGISRNPNHASYVGAVFVVPATEVDAKAAKTDMTTVAIVCIADARSTLRPAMPRYQNGRAECAPNTSEVYQ